MKRRCPMPDCGAELEAAPHAYANGYDQGYGEGVKIGREEGAILAPTSLEPPVGVVVRDRYAYLWQRTQDGWSRIAGLDGEFDDDPYLTWAQVIDGYGPVALRSWPQAAWQPEQQENP